MTPPAHNKRKYIKNIHQKQKRLDKMEIEQLITEYRGGSTVYELAAQFGCHRTTVSGCLKAHGIQMRLRPLSEEQVDEAIRLYESGLSLAKVGKLIGADARTVRTRLSERSVRIRDPHGVQSLR